MSQQPTNSSLLSLSIVAANAHPIPVSGHNSKHHRRLSSTSKTRRRLSDARDAANRPTSATAAALSLASLSLSSSPPSGHHISTSLGSASSVLVSDAGLSPSQILKLEPVEYATNGNAKSPNAAAPIPITNGKNRKRGMDHKCESCSKIYRHPSCLIKHRWEHTPHWREASKYVLSKHQQVQLLEAAAILSHLSPSSSSLPEDRSLWPSFLSGGSLPPPENTALTSFSPQVSTSLVSSQFPKPTSSSVPTSGTSYPHSPPLSYPTNGVGPKLHDYALPSLNNGVTELRPGLVGIPNGTSSIHGGVTTPTPVGLVESVDSVPTRDSVPPLMEEDEDPKRDKHASPRPRSHSDSDSIAISNTSGSRSRSTSTSGEEEDEMPSYNDGEKRWQGFAGRRYIIEEGVEEDDKWNVYGRGKKEEEGWDGMEMDMEMD